MTEAVTVTPARAPRPRAAAPTAAKACFLACLILAPGAGAQDLQPIERKPSAVAPKPTRESSGGEIVVATVGEAQLTLRTLQHLIQPRLRAGAKRLSIDRDKDPERYRALKRSCEEQILSEWLAVTLLAYEARARGLSLTAAEAREAMATIEQQVAQGGGGSFFEMARESGMDPAMLDRMIREALLGDKYIRSLIRESVSEEGLRKLYDKNPQAYVIQPWRRHLYHFTAMRDEGLNTRALRSLLVDAQRKIEQGADAAPIAAEIQAGKIAIVKDARLKEVIPEETATAMIETIERSADAYDMWITADYAFKEEELTKAAFGMKVGQVSGIVNSAGGYHFIKVAEEQQAQGTSFEECRSAIEEGLMGKLREPLAIQALESLKGQTKINRKYLTQIVEEESTTDDSEEDMFQRLLRIREERAKREARQRNAFDSDK